MSESVPMAYFITFTCYGTWLHGDSPGSVDLIHNEYATPFLGPDKSKQKRSQERLQQEPYRLDSVRRKIVLKAVEEVCCHRGWTLLAAHVRTNHVHTVVEAAAKPERIMNDFKAYASRALNAAGCDEPNRRRWTRHGSTRYLWDADHVESAIVYVVDEQGESMAVFQKDDGREADTTEPAANITESRP